MAEGLRKLGAAGPTWIIIGLLISAIVFPPILMGVGLVSTYSVVLRNAEEQANSTIDLLNEHARRVLDTHAIALKQLKERLGDRSLDDVQNSAQFHQYLRDLSQDIGSPNVLWITDAAGIARSSSLAFPSPQLDLSDREYFIQQRLQDAGTFLSVPYQRRVGTQTWAFGMSQRLTGPNGEFMGVVHAAIDTDYFITFWKQLSSSLTPVIPLMRDDGELLVRFPANLGERFRLPSEAPFRQAVARSRNGFYRAVSLIDGVERINAYRQVGTYPLTISFSVAVDSVVASWRRTAILVGAFALAGWITLIAVTLKALFLARRESHAIKRFEIANAQRIQAEEHLRQSQKMESIGRLTGGIAHDFNNLLTVVLGSLDLLRRRLPQADPKLMRLVDNSIEGAKRAAILTDRLLQFSRQQPLQPTSVDINKCVQTMSELLQRTLGEAIKIETVLGARLWHAHVDPNMLENAILNLAVNARDAMPLGGRLTIETSNADLDRFYAKGVEVAPGRYVLLAVTDTGEGMDASTLRNAFEPFFTTKAVGQGTGLGLSQVYGFVKQSGGHVALYSEPGVGTTAKIYLPRSEASPVNDVDESGAIPTHHGRYTILLVEDDADVRQFAKECLRELDCSIVEAEGPRAALEILERELDLKLDLLFTDVVMPEMSGAQLAKRAIAMRPGLRVLYMTGYTRNAIIHNGVLDAGTHLLTKPFTLPQLANKLDEMWKSS